MTLERCPRCGALTRPSQEWCTLCHCSLVEAPTLDPLSAPLELLDGDAATEPTPAVPAPDANGLVDDAHALVGAPAPVGKHARHAAQPAVALGYAHADAAAVDDVDDLDAQLPDGVDAMLAQLALQQRQPMPKALSWMPADRNARLMVTFVAAMLLTGLGWACFWLLSLVF